MVNNQRITVTLESIISEASAFAGGRPIMILYPYLKPDRIIELLREEGHAVEARRVPYSEVVPSENAYILDLRAIQVAK